MDFIPVEYYFLTYLLTLTIISLAYAMRMMGQTTALLQRNSNGGGALIYILLVTLFLGLRPVSGRYFVDMVTYAHTYSLYIHGRAFVTVGEGEWIWNGLTYLCSQVMDVQLYFLVVEILYIFPVLWSCKKMVPRHFLLMFLFCMGAFSFYSYATNGVRNGVACSVTIAALACLLSGEKREKIMAAVLCFLAVGCHRSTALPVLCMWCSLMVKDFKQPFIFWMFSIVISLVAGSSVEAFFTSMGFDDRLETYSSANAAAALFSSTGFRWDFLLYSCMPIVLGYYVFIKRQIKDRRYLILMSTYILCNSFWVMMIRAAYSNRFAYLSWFMYAIVLAYPCLKLPVWRRQGSAAALIFLAHLSFTLFMVFIYYS